MIALIREDDSAPWEVFISHSARDRNGEYTSVAGAVIQDLEVRLKDVIDQGSIGLLIDKNLPAGQDWNPAIRWWLARCNAAIILLDRKALDSEWVKREVCILMQCRALYRDLAVLPVLIDLEEKRLKGSIFEDLLVMQLRQKSTTGDILNEVMQFLEKNCAGRLFGIPSAMSRWIKNISIQLPNLRETLKQAAWTLGYEFNGISMGRRADISDRQWLAALFLEVDGSVRDLQRLAKAIGGMCCQIDPPRRPDLAHLLSPVWVNAEQAYPLLPHPDRDKERRLILLPANEPTTAEYYIKRATCCADPSRVAVRILGGGRKEEETEARLGEVKTVLKRLMGSWSSGCEPERLYFLIIPFGGAELHEEIEVVKRVYEQYPLVNVLKLAGTDGVAEWKKAVRLHPWQVIELGIVSPAGEENSVAWVQHLEEVLGVAPR